MTEWDQLSPFELSVSGGGVEQPTSTISAIAGKKAFIIIKLPSGLQVSLIIYIGIVADILRISLSLYKL